MELTLIYVLGVNMNSSLKILRITGINGLYNELYSPNPLTEKEEEIISKGVIDLGRQFWNRILSRRELNKILDYVRLNSDNEVSIKILSALANTEKFIENVAIAKTKICDQGIDIRQFYSYLETLSIVCEIYSKYLYNGIVLTINDGLCTDETSSKVMYENCTKVNTNPSFHFIQKEVVPEIKKYNPDIIFLDGKPNLSLFCVAKLIKQNGLHSHICCSYNSSEYYSLSKIRAYLKNNMFLFKAYDSVILDDFNKVEEELVNELSNKKDLSTVRNLIYYDGDHIIETKISNNHSSKPIVLKRNSNSDNSFVMSPKLLADIHLVPNQKCYWNKCAFCGINKKYLFDDICNDSFFYYNLSTIINEIKESRIQYVWFIDEAIPPKRLKEIANAFIENNIHIIWQARCRIEEELILTDLPELLYQSGLRELRLGLESASVNVLRLMNKFPEDFKLSTVTQIVSKYDSVGVSIHFPMIVGFPGESKEDRRITYSYLSTLRKRYPSLTFNINILSLDVSSPLFKKWYNYELDRIELPCPTDELLGNIAIYNKMYDDLDKERDTFMKEQLYPWFPIDSIISPHIFYRLSETIRNTLIWKEERIFNQYHNNEFIQTKYKFINNISFHRSKDVDSFAIIYNWNTHRYFKAPLDFFDLLTSFSIPIEIKEMISKSMSGLLKNVSYDECYALFINLIKLGFLVPVFEKSFSEINSVCEKYSETALYYDAMYLSERINYIPSETFLVMKYLESIPKGKALEVGIGVGKNIQRLLDNGFEVHGIDISKVAILKVKKHNLKHCQFECMDITNAQLKPYSYTLIICSMSLHYLDLSDFIQVVSNLKSSLVEGGYLYIGVLSQNDALYNYNDTHIKHFFTKEEIQYYFRDLTLIEINDSISYDNSREITNSYWGTINAIYKKKGG